MPASNIVAYLCEGQFWCPLHCEPDAEDLAQNFVTPISEFDVMVGTSHAEMLDDACCAGCGIALKSR